MKELVIKEIDHKGVIDIDLAEKLLENNAKFRIAYLQDQILLKYYVNEENSLTN